MRTVFLIAAALCFVGGVALLALAGLAKFGPVAVAGNMIAVDGRAGDLVTAGLCAWLLGGMLFVVREVGSNRIRSIK